MTALGVVLPEYEAEIKSFLDALNRIDRKHGTHAIMLIKDFQPDLPWFGSESNIPTEYYREITIDGIVLQGEPDGT